MTEQMQERLRVAGVDYGRVFPGQEIWAPVHRVEEVKTAILDGLEAVLRESREGGRNAHASGGLG